METTSQDITTQRQTQKGQKRKGHKYIANTQDISQNTAKYLIGTQYEGPCLLRSRKRIAVKQKYTENEKQ